MIDLVFGLGQGGARIAKSFSKVYDASVRYLNLTSLDFKAMSIPKHHSYVLEEGGSGRDPIVGETLVKENFEGVSLFLDDAVKLNKAKLVVVCVGLGGGSGVGFLFPVLNFLLKKKISVILVAALPQKSEGLPAQPNALQAVNRLISKYIGKDLKKHDQIVPIIVDNDYCLDRYGEYSDDNYWYRVNKGIALSLKRFYDLTTDFSNSIDIASGYNALDYREFKKILLFKNGFLDVREINLKSIDEAYDIKKNVKSASLISGSMNINTTKAYIISVALPSAWKDNKRIGDGLKIIFDSISKMTRTPYVLRSSYYSSKIKTATVSLLLAGLTKSHSLDKHLKNAAKNVDKFNKKEDIELLDISSLNY